MLLIKKAKPMSKNKGWWEYFLYFYWLCSKNHKEWNCYKKYIGTSQWWQKKFTERSGRGFITYIPLNVHVPTNSTLHSYDTANSSMLLRDANTNMIDWFIFSFFGDSVSVESHNEIDFVGNNDKIRDILNHEKCFSCENHQNNRILIRHAWCFKHSSFQWVISWFS